MKNQVSNGSVLTPDIIEEMVKAFNPVPCVNKMFKDFVASEMDVPEDPVYIVQEELFEQLDPDPQIFMDKNIVGDKMYVMSREAIDNPFYNQEYKPLNLS